VVTQSHKTQAKRRKAKKMTDSNKRRECQTAGNLLGANISKVQLPDGRELIAEQERRRVRIEIKMLKPFPVLRLGHI
jgi:hypothetical protein